MSTSNMNDKLEEIRAAMAEIDCVTTCKIGLEKNMSPADYPMIRIVPIRFTPLKLYALRQAETAVYFGANVTEPGVGLESVYESLLKLEEDIINVIKALNGRYIETITDEDRLDTYKLMFIRFEIDVQRPSMPT